MTHGVELDAQLIALLAAGDRREAATVAVRTLGPPVLRYLRSLCDGEDEAADAFSQWAENLWKRIDTWRGDASFRSWAFRVAAHAAGDVTGAAWKRRGRRLLTAEASALAAEVLTSAPAREEEQRRALEALRAKLTLGERSLIALRVDQELSWEEIARVVANASGVPPRTNTLVKRFERVKEKLAKEARKQGLIR